MVKNKILVEVSARHVHLSERDFYKLFGKSAKLTFLKKLSQPGEFAAKETVSIKNKNKIIKDLRVVGPFRNETQIEISMSDAFYLNKKVPTKLSGDLKGTPGLIVIGPKGEIKLNRGLIIAQRHLHLSIEDAERLEIKDKENISVFVGGKRAISFHNTVTRVSENYKTAFHIDIDEANSAGINKKTYCSIIK